MECLKEDNCPLKKSTLNLWKMETKILFNDIHWLISQGKSRLFSIVSLTSLQSIPFYFPSVLYEKPLHPFRNKAEGILFKLNEYTHMWRNKNSAFKSVLGFLTENVLFLH